MLYFFFFFFAAAMMRYARQPDAPLRCRFSLRAVAARFAITLLCFSDEMMMQQLRRYSAAAHA